MSLAQITQVPLRDQMYINGVMANTWVYFFQRLADLNTGLVDLSELEQLVKQLPSQAIQGQQQFEINEIKNQIPLVPIFVQQIDHYIPAVAINLPGEQPMPLLPLPVQEVISA